VNSDSNIDLLTLLIYYLFIIVILSGARVEAALVSYLGLSVPVFRFVKKWM